METKLINEIFSNLSIDEIKEQYHNHFVEVPDTFRFAKVNIVIGPNGSGKTRFLKALRDLYLLHDENSVIYGYFPSLSDKKPIPKTDEEPPATLFESIGSGDISFKDFFREIEQHNEEFIQELLLHRSQRKSEIWALVSNSFHALTNKSLSFNADGQVFIEEGEENIIPLSAMLDRLSPGELMLFYMAIFLALRKDGAKGKAIILDEPECHLHPRALRAFINLLIKQYNLGSIWIATHSIFLVPDFQFENIVYIENSKIQSRNSVMYRSILDCLLGDGKSIEAFFSSLSQWQFCEFIAECFTDPTVIDIINPEDEQVQFMFQHLIENKPMRILDWGGGSARLGESLIAAGLKHNVDFSYEIYDIDPKYSGKEFDVFTNLEDISGKYHCIVMMNFLHELAPIKWPNIFRHVSEHLENGGFLLFVEVNALCEGEMPNDVGYLLLGAEDLQQLFSCTFTVHMGNKSIGVLIPKEALAAATTDSVNRALRNLEKRTLCEIKEIRSSKEYPKELMEVRALTQPRYYAFLLQQYVNVKLFNEKDVKEEKALAEIVEDAIAENEKLTLQSKNLEGDIAAAKAENAKLVFEIQKLKLEILTLKIDSQYEHDPSTQVCISKLLLAVDRFRKQGYISKKMSGQLVNAANYLKYTNSDMYECFLQAMRIMQIKSTKRPTN